MQYFLLGLTDLPQVRFAHRYETQSYANRLCPAEQSKVEFTYIEKGDLTLQNAKGERTFCPEHSVISIFYREEQAVTSNGKPHSHVTFCLTGVTVTPVTPEEALQQILSSNGRTVLAQDCIMHQKTANYGKSVIEDIISLFADSGDTIDVLHKVVSFLQWMHRTTTEQLLANSGQGSFSDIRYTKQATSYIAKHVYDSVKVSEIAETAGISVGHLSRIFKANTGYSLVEYCNKTKVETAKNILLHSDTSVKELASMLSLGDEKYLCRMFRKYAGMTISEWKKRNR